LGELQLWNNANKQLHRSTLLGGDTLFGLSWTHDSSMLALGMADNSIRALDLEGNQKLYQRTHDDWPRSTVFTVDGKHLLSGARDMTVKLTDVETERFIDNVTSITPGALRGGVQALARHPERDEILVGGSDGTPRIYRVFRQTARVIGDDANLIRQLDPMPGRIFSVAISPDGKYLAAASTIDNQSVVKVWSYDVDGKLPPEIKAIQAKRAPQRKPDERKKLEEYITEQPQVLGTFQVPNAAVYALAIDAQGRLASGGSDGRIRIWNIADSQLIADLDATPAGSLNAAQDSSLASLRIDRLKAIGEAHLAERTTEAPKAQGELAHPPVRVDQIASIQVQPSQIEFGAWNDSAQIVVMAHAGKNEVRPGRCFARGACRAAAVLGDPGIGFAAAAVVHTDLMAGARQMRGHRRAHDAQTDKGHALRRNRGAGARAHGCWAGRHQTIFRCSVPAARSVLRARWLLSLICSRRSLTESAFRMASW
jgi:hypothetical protein